jgi:hypothetical protein
VTSPVGTLTISDGTVPSSARRGAVIGLDYGKGGNSTINNISISGGTITTSTATRNDEGGAGIGTGYAARGSSRVGSITITGGHVNLSSSWGAGIGSGYAVNGDSNATGEIVINHDPVIYIRSSEGAGIRSGYVETNSSSPVQNIVISGGTIKAITDYGAETGVGSADKGRTRTTGFIFRVDRYTWKLLMVVVLELGGDMQ